MKSIITPFLIVSISSATCFFSSCIDNYLPENQINFEPRIVVEALITNEDELQQIKISQSTTLDSLAFIPLSGCFVEVIDNFDQSFTFNETSEGIYEGLIDSQYFSWNRTFQLHLILNNGEEYESEIERFLPSSEIDSIHYKIEEKETSDVELTYQGLQFYYNFIASEISSRYYKISIEETWEYRATFPITIFYSGGFQKINPDSSLFYCYNTKTIDDLYLMSTKGFDKNEFPNYKLHFTNNQSQRLKYRYSLLITQFSLSENTYKYWYNLKKNNEDNGGLFSSQPALVEGNIYKINDPSSKLLGYFGVSSIQKKRIFVDPVENLRIYNEINCEAMPFIQEPGGWPFLTEPDEWPIYFVKIYDPASESSIMGIAEQACFDCRLYGGTLTKPDFWK